ncbi:L,D-transpeptidase family protein [Microvirga aerophila]|uniref:Murein L,D-transpeptidase n=1 Tax=Microvirga aerophila TaxID=670291 RepID=A0A512BQH0_9HYPH|nr:L,D-transpeptidase family protein [Microvirga aerophila]GEO14276.1 murein L,D-transpeptidase [Microvirga aerophila]
MRFHLGLWLALLSSTAGASAQAAPGLVAPVASPAPKADGKPVVPAPPTAVAVSQDPRPTLSSDTFIHTVRAAGIYKHLAEAGGWASLPADTILKAGDKGPLVTALRERLATEGDLPGDMRAGQVFDQALTTAVKRFQARHGLPESGAVRAKTLEALNVPAQTRHRQLAASAKRLMSSAFPFGERYVVVNIPSATVEAVEGGQVARRYVAVVGKVDRPSPTVETRITAVNLNPTWTVPVSLIKKDIIPHVRKDPAYLAKMKIRILDGKGQEVDPQTLDWSTNNAVNYTLRQDPGEANSLGQIRIDMPNRDAVYMHDTPTKRLFAQDVRFHSSGCVRVADVRSFAEWLLRGTNGPGGAWNQDAIDTAIATTNRQDLRLDKPIPVAWVYLTGYGMPDGTAHFRNDVYGLDAPMSDPVPDADPVDVQATSSVKSSRS